MAAQDEQHLYSLPFEEVPTTPDDYNGLINKPILNGHTIEGDKTAADYGIVVPTKVSDLPNDANYAKQSQIPTYLSQLVNNVGFITSSDLPTKTSELTNDSGFITSSDLPTKTSELTNDSGFTTKTYVDGEIATVRSDIPTKTSDLTNDSGFITSSALPTRTSQLTNDSGFITASALPTNTSDLVNDSGFTTKTYVDGEIATIRSDIPTKTSDLTNNSGFITSADLPTKTSQLTNDSGFITASVLPTNTSDLVNDSGFTTKTYVDGEIATIRSDIPTKTSDLTNNSGFITSADLPTKTSELTNDSDFTTKTYVDNEITAVRGDIPTVNNATLTIQKNGNTVQTFTANANSNKTANITVPTKTSELTNDSDFTTKTYVDNEITAVRGNIPTVNNATLTIQKNGNTVQTFTANANSNKTANITVPTKTSDLTNNSGFTTKTYVDAEIAKLAVINGMTVVSQFLATATFNSTFDNLASALQTQLASIKSALTANEFAEIKALKIATIGNVKPSSTIKIDANTNVTSLVIDWQGISYNNNVIRAIDIANKKVVALTMTNDLNDDAYVSYVGDATQYSFTLEYNKYKTINLT